jgi:hypothetical protein
MHYRATSDHSMNYRASLTRISSNAKTGPIPVSMSEKSTCPNACPLKGSGCYAESGHVNIHWQKISKGERGKVWGEFCADVASLPKGQLWRMNVAGDLPSIDAENIDAVALALLVKANKGKQGFTYTHYNPFKGGNYAAIKNANNQGFTINLSADNLEEADQLKSLGIAPVVTILPSDAEKVTITPAGNQVVVCPAVQNPSITCATCGVCAVAIRRTIIGFPVHGTSKAKAQKVFMLKQG